MLYIYLHQMHSISRLNHTPVVHRVCTIPPQETIRNAERIFYNSTLIFCLFMKNNLLKAVYFKINTYICRCKETYKAVQWNVEVSGLFGFDSGMKRYVSTRRLVGYLLNQSRQSINWRKQLRSRCLIEA